MENDGNSHIRTCVGVLNAVNAIPLPKGGAFARSIESAERSIDPFERSKGSFEGSIEAAERTIGTLSRSNDLLTRARQSAEHSNDSYEPVMEPAAVNDSLPSVPLRILRIDYTPFDLLIPVLGRFVRDL